MKSSKLQKAVGLAPVLLLGLSSLSAPCGAEVVPPVPPKTGNEMPVISDAAEKKILGHLQETSLSRLKGWPGMIFFCAADEGNNPALKTLCQETYTVLESLAAQNSVKFHKARHANDMMLLPHLTGRLKLLVELIGTDPAASPAAISARISVLAHYTGAVNRYADLSLGDISADKHPLNVPQHVDGILWESNIIRAGARPDELVGPVRDSIAEQLKVFFADYAKANQ
ncbi:hypothetical protein [Methyloterricola oryzae]|uniref:hypothetical protein n=1 Tax=Methyloterricola oryzae TaxID=1495050 RepID=UPI00069BC987|nr:hypothetical protein [Methyloterricola oryzae]